MRTFKNLWLIIGSFLLIAFMTQNSFAQSFKLNEKASNLQVDGTSNLHDWTIEAKNMAGMLTVNIEDGKIIDVEELEFVVGAESLKSGKSGMDKNTYKALDTDKHSRITYNLTKVKDIDCAPNGKCKIQTQGYLNISGSKKLIDITFEAAVSGSNVILGGQTPIVMTEYGIDPPTAMFGTITTGDKVVVKFKSVFSK